MAQPNLTDADLIGALKLVRQHGTIAAAARAAGMPPQTMHHRVSCAEAKGYTADTVLRDPVEKMKIEAHDPSPPEWLLREGANGARGMPMLFASDWHYGEVVRQEEVGGVNEFNATIAARRIKRMTETAIDLAYNHMGKAKTVYPGIVLLYGGDMISGDIHEELMATNDRTPVQCVNDLTDLMGAQIDALAQKFGRVHIPCVTGNHGRTTKRVRAKGRVFTSYEWNIYCNLKRDFRRTKTVTFQIPEQTDAPFRVYGHRFLLTHGDTLGVKGGDGIIGALGPIRRGEIKIRNAESQVDNDFDTLCIGHWHQYITLPGLIVNNSLKGFDEYARSFLRAPYSRPSQAFWFCHPEHGITAHWQIYLEGQKRAARPKTLEWQE